MADQCKPEDCAVHDYVTGSLARFEEIVGKLVEGQHQTQMNIVKLTENLEMLKRLHERVDKLEGFMMKSVGGGAVLVFLIPLAITIVAALI